MPLLTIHAGKVDFFNNAIKQFKCLEVSIEENKLFKFFPKKVIEFSGEIYAIGEHVEQRCMVDIPLSQLNLCNEVDDKYESIYSEIEINEFIKNLREVEGTALRLVLKIDHSFQNFGLPNGLQHLGKTYMTTNGNGDRIWAATVESSLGLMEWLHSIHSRVEILDPQAIKDDFYRYCHYLENKGA